MAKTTEEKIKVMQAYTEGKEIEIESVEGGWYVVPEPSWNWRTFDYRVKPEPKVLWVVYSRQGVRIGTLNNEYSAASLAHRKDGRYYKKFVEVTEE